MPKRIARKAKTARPRGRPRSKLSRKKIHWGMNGPPRKVGAKKAVKRGASGLESTMGAIGSAIGGSIAPGIGSVAGEFIGRGAGKVFGKIFGRGDYVVESNTLRSGPPPVFGQQQIRLTNREYLGEVNGSVLYTNASYPINPGMAQTFPWLSQIAPLFQQYEMNGLVFEFVSTSATALNSTNTALGKVILATNYNATEAPFPDQRSALITTYSNYGKPAESLMHPIECKRSHTPIELLYVRSGPTDPSTDIRLYDLGNFQIMTEGMQAVADIGALWVSYDVTLIKPVLAVQGATIPSQLFSLNGMSGGAFNSVVDLGPSQSTMPVVLEPISPVNSAIVFTTNSVGSVYDIQLSGTVGTGLPTPKLIASYINCVDLIPDNPVSKPVGTGLTFYSIPSNPTTPGSWFAHMQVRLTNATSLTTYPTILIQQNIQYANGSLGQLFITQINSNPPSSPQLQLSLPPGFLAYKDTYRAPKKRVEHPPSLIPEFKCEVDEKGESVDEEVFLEREVQRSYHRPTSDSAGASSSSSSSSLSDSRSSSLSRALKARLPPA